MSDSSERVVVTGGLQCNHFVFIAEKSDGTRTIHGEHNMVVDTGRINSMKGILPFTTSPVTMVAIGAGVCSTAEDYAQDRLIYELIGNAARKDLTRTTDSLAIASNPLTNSDIVSEVVTIGGFTFRKKVVLQAVYDFVDSNNGNTFREYALFSTATLPGTPTGLSGVMYNRIVDPSPIPKDINTKIIIQITMRW